MHGGTRVLPTGHGSRNGQEKGELNACMKTKVTPASRTVSGGEGAGSGKGNMLSLSAEDAPDDGCGLLGIPRIADLGLQLSAIEHFLEDLLGPVDLVQELTRSLLGNGLHGKEQSRRLEP